MMGEASDWATLNASFATATRAGVGVGCLLEVRLIRRSETGHRRETRRTSPRISEQRSATEGVAVTQRDVTNQPIMFHRRAATRGTTQASRAETSREHAAASDFSVSPLAGVERECEKSARPPRVREDAQKKTVPRASQISYLWCSSSKSSLTEGCRCRRASRFVGRAKKSCRT